MAWPEDMFGPPSIIHDDPWASQLALIDAELAKPRAPAPPPGALEPGGVPAAAIDAVAPGSVAPPMPAAPPAQPPYAIVPNDEPATLPPEKASSVDAPEDALASHLTRSTFGAQSDEAGGEIDMAGDPLAEVKRNPLDDEDATPEEIAARLDEVAKTDPGLAAQYQVQREAKKALELQKQQNEALIADNARAEENLRDHTEARAEAKRYSAQVEAEAQKVANERIDSGKWWADRSTGQKVAGFIAAIVGGLVQGRRGGQNDGIAFIEREIERDIGAQRENLAHRRAEIARKTGRTREMLGDADADFQFAESARVGAWGRVVRELEIKAQQFDPRGTQALQIFHAANEARGKAAAAQAAAEAAKFDRSLKIREDQRKERDAILKEKKFAGAGASGPKYSPADLARLYETDAVPPIPMSVKEYERWLGTKGKIKNLTTNKDGLEAQKTAAEIEKAAREGRVPGIMVDDGTGKKVEFVATAGTPEEISKVRKAVTSTKTFVRMLDEAARIRSGWSSDLAQSPEWQKLRANWAMAIGAAKDLLDLGALAEADMALVNKIMGTSDPTQARSILAGLKKARENALSLTNDRLHQIGLPEGERFDIKDISRHAPPSASASDLTFQSAQKEPSLTNVIEAWKAAHPNESMPGPDEMRAEFVDPGKKPTLDNVLLPNTRTFIQDLGVRARSKDPKEADEARTALIKLMERGGNTATKGFAETTLRAVDAYSAGVQ